MLKPKNFFLTMIDDLDDSMSLAGELDDFDRALAVLFDMYGVIYHSRELLANKERSISQLFNDINSELESMSKYVSAPEEYQIFDSHADNLIKIIKDFMEVVE